MLPGASVAALACLFFGACGSAPDPFLVLSGPKDLVHFEIRDEVGETVWAVRADPSQTLNSIFYGSVPLGFVQVEPSDGTQPRSLVPGEVLTAETRSRTRVFLHRGVAETPSRMLIYDWSMHLLDTP